MAPAMLSTDALSSNSPSAFATALTLAGPRIFLREAALGRRLQRQDGFASPGAMRGRGTRQPAQDIARHDHIGIRAAGAARCPRCNLTRPHMANMAANARQSVFAMPFLLVETIEYGGDAFFRAMVEKRADCRIGCAFPNVLAAGKRHARSFRLIFCHRVCTGDIAGCRDRFLNSAERPGYWLAGRRGVFSRRASDGYCHCSLCQEKRRNSARHAASSAKPIAPITRTVAASRSYSSVSRASLIA